MDAHTLTRVRNTATALGRRFEDSDLIDPELRALAREVAFEYSTGPAPTTWVGTAIEAVHGGRESDGYLRGLLNFAAGQYADPDARTAERTTPNPPPTPQQRRAARAENESYRAPSAGMNFREASDNIAEAGTPTGRYAVESFTGNGELRFFRVRTYRGRVYFDRIVGSGYGHGFNRAGMLDPERAYAVRAINADPLGCAQRFAAEVGRCARCLSPLTDETSRERGLGPDCEQHYGLTR